MLNSITFVRVALFASLGVGIAGGAISASSQAPTSPAEPMPTCLPVLMPSGDADWYCGDVIRIPDGAQVMERGLTPCGNEDGSGGPLPCRWDARMRGDRRGESFTVLPDGAPAGGVQHVLYRYDHGVTARGEVLTCASATMGPHLPTCPGH